ncbi:MAG TPA: hypothetical protein VG603_09325, partial [Chitinophagales bacterium]|nr:hypothetical protein [Chitinophagales bacterium]
PGFGGQKFIGYSTKKVRECKHLVMQSGAGSLIEVDGGVGLENARELAHAGADVLVAGNAVFGTDNPMQTIHQIKETAAK